MDGHSLVVIVLIATAAEERTSAIVRESVPKLMNSPFIGLHHGRIAAGGRSVLLRPSRGLILGLDTTLVPVRLSRSNRVVVVQSVDELEQVAVGVQLP